MGQGAVGCRSARDGAAGRQTTAPSSLAPSDLLLRLDELFARYAQPHDQRRRDQHRRADAEADADGQRQREVVQRFAAEDSIESTIICVEPWVMMVRLMVLVMAWSSTWWRRQPRTFLKVSRTRSKRPTDC